MELTASGATHSLPTLDQDLQVTPRAQRVVIVGGGFAGAALAYHLLTQRRPQLRVSLIEPAARLGRGVAYGAESPLLRLNVPASRMSIDPEQPDDFVTWSGSEPNAFMPRALYGKYVSTRLRQAAAANPGRLRIVRAAAIDVCRGPETASGSTAPARAVHLEDGRTVYGDQVVIATGLSARTRSLDLQLPRDRRVVDAWDERALRRVSQMRRVLVLGSGLSALDALKLMDVVQHRGEVVVLSRHGLLPRPHASEASSFAIPREMLPVPVGLRALIGWTRRLVAEAERMGGCWQHALDALRPMNQRIWQSLSEREQRQFLRHVKAYWEVVRHRAPLDAIEEVAEARLRGTLRVEAGRVVHCRAEKDALVVCVRDRQGRERSERFDGLVRCLGPSSDIEDAPPLVAAMVRAGDARVCSTRLGIVTGELGRVVDSRGVASDDLFALGALCRASRWETTSVPDIVRDAAALAGVICRRDCLG